MQKRLAETIKKVVAVGGLFGASFLALHLGVLAVEYVRDASLFDLPLSHPQAILSSVVLLGVYYYVGQEDGLTAMFLLRLVCLMFAAVIVLILFEFLKEELGYMWRPLPENAA